MSSEENQSDPAQGSGIYGLRPGDTLGPYTIAKQIGAGGCGIVFKAHDPLIDRSVAVKQITSGGQPQSLAGFTTAPIDDALRDRVRQEATLQKKLAAQFPQYLVQLIDVIDEPRGLFLVSQYIDGPSLEQVLAQAPEPMDIKQALGIIAATARALEVIHNSGVIHRDLKPANILLPRDGGLKISDFGLAAVIAEQDSLTLGSARYMSPELFTGTQADGRADLYSLGMIAYEMLAGRTRFEHAFKSVLRDQRNQAMRWMKWHTNSRTQVAALYEIVEELPTNLSDLVARLMEKELSRRIATAGELQKVIKRHFTGPKPKVHAHARHHAQAPTAHPGDTAPLPTRSRRRLILAAGIGLVLVVAIGFAVVTNLKNRAQVAKHKAQAQVILDGADQAYQSNQFTEAIRVYKQVADQWDQSTPLGRQSRAALLLSQGRLDMEQSRFAAALKNFQEAGSFGLLSTQTLDDLIRQAKQRGAFAAAIAQIEQDILAQRFAEARQQVRQWRRLTLADSELAELNRVAAQLEDQRTQQQVAQLLARARSLVQKGQRDQAITDLGAALAHGHNRQLQQRYDELLAEDSFTKAVNRGLAAQTLGDLPKAIAAYRAAYAVRKDEAVAEKLAQLQSRLALGKGLALLEAGQVAAAELELTRSLGYLENQAARQALGRIESSTRQASFISAGDQAMAGGEFEAAVNHYNNAAALGADPRLQKKITGARVRLLLRRSLDSLDQGDVKEAQALFADARRIDPEHPALAGAKRELYTQSQYLRYLRAGDAARDASKFGEAKLNYRRAAKVIDTPAIRKRLSETEYDHLIAQARSYLASEEYASARALLHMAGKIRMTQEIGRLLSEIDEHLPSNTDGEETED